MHLRSRAGRCGLSLFEATTPPVAPPGLPLPGKPPTLVQPIEFPHNVHVAKKILIAGATFAAMTLLYVLFAKVVPIISIWELKAGAHVPSTLVSPATQEHPLGELHL